MAFIKYFNPRGLNFAYVTNGNFAYDVTCGVKDSINIGTTGIGKELVGIVAHIPRLLIRNWAQFLSLELIHSIVHFY